MRLFAAVPLPETGRSECAEVLAAARVTGWPVRWVRDDLAHITLKFFGEVVPERLDVIAEALESAAKGSEPMSLRLQSLGAFPTFRRPRVVWLGVDAPTSLELLKDRVERFAEGIGFPPEGVPFRPHVTLGRVREGQRLPHGAIESCGIEAAGAPFLADTVVLYESSLTSAGPEYTPRLTLTLGR
ncbi:MAG TPA: RNA 2',3'-cyclic phosphodiesterase [Gemmatimonadales bacterium]